MLLDNIGYMFCCASSGSGTWFVLRFQSVENNPQIDFARVADRAGHSIVLALLDVSFLVTCGGQ